MILRISYEIFIVEIYFVCMSTVFLNLLLSISVRVFENLFLFSKILQPSCLADYNLPLRHLHELE